MSGGLHTMRWEQRLGNRSTGAIKSEERAAVKAAEDRCSTWSPHNEQKLGEAPLLQNLTKHSENQKTSKGVAWKHGRMDSLQKKNQNIPEPFHLVYKVLNQRLLSYFVNDSSFPYGHWAINKFSYTKTLKRKRHISWDLLNSVEKTM